MIQRVKLSIDKSSNNEVLINGYTRSSILENISQFDPYEFIANPREILYQDSNSEIKVYINISISQIDKIISDVFTCIICQHIMYNASNIRECMHTFCHECIMKQIKIKKECPTCRKMIDNKRHLREHSTLNFLSNFFNL